MPPCVHLSIPTARGFTRYVTDVSDVSDVPGLGWLAWLS